MAEKKKGKARPVDPDDQPTEVVRPPRPATPAPAPTAPKPDGKGK